MDSRNLFDDLPNEVTETISAFLPKSDNARLASTCYRFYDCGLEDSLFSLFNPSYNTAIRLAREQLACLLNHIIRGEQDEAEQIIKNDPGLLLETGTVVDYSGRKIKGTALQLALGAEDVKYHDDEVCMVEMILKHLQAFENGEEIIAEQIAKQFPEDWLVKEEQRKRRDSDALNATFNIILNSNNPLEWENAIKIFTAYLAFENKNRIIATGKHFNHQLLIEAFDLYQQQFNQLGGYNNAKNNLVWRKVIGTIQRYVPAATAQALCTCIGNIVENTDPLKRDLMLPNYHTDNDISYFPLDSNPNSILGQDFTIMSLYLVYGLAVSFQDTNVLDAYNPFFEKKHNNLLELCDTYRPGLGVRVSA